MCILGEKGEAGGGLTEEENRRVIVESLVGARSIWKKC